MLTLACNTNPKDPTWLAHLAEIERLKDQARRQDNPQLAVSLELLLLDHRAREGRLYVANKDGER